MRILIAAALGALIVVSFPFLDVVDNGASAQVLLTQPGNAPADALARVLHQRKQAKKLGALQTNKRSRTKNLFQHRQSVFDQTYGNKKAKNDIIRRMQK